MRLHPFAVPAIVLGTALLAAVLLVAASLQRPTVEGFVPTTTATETAGVRRFTIDATDPDRWVFFDLDEGAVRERPAPMDWDIAFQRFRVITNGGATFLGNGAAADLGEASLDSASLSGAEWTETRARSDSTNPAIGRWYRYSWTSHLLTPLPHTYGIRTAHGDSVRLRFVSYYCPGATPGCVTFEWR